MNVLVFDTETSNSRYSNGFSARGNMTFNIGGVIIDTNTFDIVKEFNFLVSEIWNDKDVMKNFYDKDNLKSFNGTEIMPFESIKKIIKEDLKNYGVKEIYAYNISFDQQAILDTCDYLHTYVDLTPYQFNDIYAMACDMLRNLKEPYSVFCTESGRISAAGNRLTNAETVYGFLMNLPSYSEEHTALEDSRIEGTIYLECLNYEKAHNVNLERKPNHQCWRWAQG